MKMVTMYPVHLYTCMLWILSLLNLSVKADGETELIILKQGDIKNLTSEHYPELYGNNLNIHWGVRAEDRCQRIVVTFNAFHIKDGDFLYIKEEKYPSATAKYSGSNAATPYISVGNHLAINFTSDFSESSTGFHLSISCFKETDYTGIHEGFEGLEHTRVMTQPVCKDAFHTDVADTVCREAGFPGSYETNFTSKTENISESQGMNYQCKKSTYRLQDCKTSTSRCIAQDSLLIVCNVLSELGCYDLAEYIHLLTRSVMLSRDQCLTYCKALSTTPQYAVHHRGTNCSCISQTALNLTELSQERSRCRTNSESQTEHYATLFNVSLGFCSEPPELENGSWGNTLNEFMYGTTITAKCNDSYELVGEDRKMRCDMATTSTTQEFEWHGTPPSCQKINTITRPADNESLSGSGAGSSETPIILLGVLTPVIIIIIFTIIIFTIFIVWKKQQKGKKGENLCETLGSEAAGDNKRRDCRISRFLSGFCGGTKSTSTVTQGEDPEEQEPALQKMHQDSIPPSESIV